MSLPILILLRALHVVAATFWTGVMLMNAGFLLPAVRASGPAGGQVMGQVVGVRRLPRFMNLAVAITLLTGGWLLWWSSGGLSAAWLGTRRGLGYSVGAVLPVVVAILGLVVNAPTARGLAAPARRPYTPRWTGFPARGSASGAGRPGTARDPGPAGSGA